MPSPRLRNRKAGRWFWVNNVLVGGCFPGLDVYAKFTYVVLCYHANNPSNATRMFLGVLAEEVGCSLAKLKLALERLEAAGLVMMESGSGRGKGNTFLLTDANEAARKQSQGGLFPEEDQKKEPPDGPFEREKGPPDGSFSAESSHVVAPVYKTTAKTKEEKTTTIQPPPSEPSGVDGAERPPEEGRPEGPSQANGALRDDSGAIGDGSKESKHTAIKAEIFRLYLEHNPGVEKVPWDGLAGARLNVMMGKSGWTVEQWCRCIRNRYASDGINVGEWPQDFIPYLGRYIAGPLDRFNKGPSHENVNPRTARNREAVRAVYEQIDAGLL